MQAINKFYDIEVISKIMVTWFISLRNLPLMNLVKVQLNAPYELFVNIRFLFCFVMYYANSQWDLAHILPRFDFDVNQHFTGTTDTI